MGFHHLDQYAADAGGLAHVAPAARVLGTFLIALAAALLPLGAWSAMLALLLLVLLLGVYAHVPLATLCLRAAAPLTFLALASLAVLVLAPGRVLWQFGFLGVTDAGVVRFVSALLRGGAAIMAGVLLISTTRFPELVQALRELRLPAVVTAALGLAYRFIYLLTDEVAQLQRAAASRNARAGVTARRTLLLGITASAFSRSFARSERVHGAMLARGYTGALPSLEPHPLDARAGRALLLLLLVLTTIVAVAHV